MKPFEGVYTALITPMTRDFEVNEDVLAKLVERNIQAGINGFWVAGGSGESVLLDDEENGRIAKIVTAQAAGRAKIIMHVGAPTTKRAAAMAEVAAGAGVDAICCVPPFFYRQRDEAVVEHYRAVAGAAGLPFFAYNLPQATNCEITPSLMGKIQDRVPQLTGLKHSAVDFGHVRTFVNMGLDCFIGRAPWLLPALSMGAVGVVDGWPGIAPEFWVKTWRAYRDGDMARAQAAQDKGIALCKLFGIGPMHGVLKAANGLRWGLDCGTPRPPGMPLTPEQDRGVRDLLTELDLLPAVAAE